MAQKLHQIQKRLAEDASVTTRVVRIDEPEGLICVDISSVQMIETTSGVSVAEDQIMKDTAYIEKVGYTLF